MPFIFEHSHFLYLLACIPAVLLLWVWYAWWQRTKKQAFGDATLINQLITPMAPGRRLVKRALLLVALVLLVVALANPILEKKTPVADLPGPDVVFAIDVSLSMLARDVAPSRLAKVRQIVTKTLEQLPSGRVSIVLYAGRAYPHLPLTADMEAARLFIQSIHAQAIAQQGTHVDQAIRMATLALDNPGASAKIVFLLSDGENHDAEFSLALREAARKRIRLYTIGIGTAAGSPVPLSEEEAITGFKKDKQGNQVVSRLDEGRLKQMAQQGGGAYFLAASTDETVRFITTNWQKAPSAETTFSFIKIRQSYFQWLLALAFLLLLTETLIGERKRTSG